MVRSWYWLTEKFFVTIHTKLTPSFFSKLDLSILLGNALERFDTSLYGFLVPVMAPLFFPHYDEIVQLICMYGIVGTSIVARPVGTFLFCVLTRRYGPICALSYSLYGVALITFGIGCLPCYESIGVCAPLLLIVMRLCKGVCAAGESAIAKLYIMEDKAEHHALRASYWYQSSSMMGTIAASIVAACIISSYVCLWRLCFLCGGMTGLIGYYMRTAEQQTVVSTLFDSQNFSKGQSNEKDVRDTVINYTAVVWRHRKNIIRVALTNCFSHATYAVPFVFMNTIVPHVTNVTLETMMMYNTVFLFLDVIAIPLLGYILEEYEYKKVMGYASGMLGITIVPLFYCMVDASLVYVMCMRLWIVLWGLVFLCPLNVWCKRLFIGDDYYILVSIGNMIATSTVAHMTTPICLWLWYVSGRLWIPALYIAILMCLTSYAVFTKNE